MTSFFLHHVANNRTRVITIINVDTAVSKRSYQDENKKDVRVYSIDTITLAIIPFESKRRIPPLSRHVIFIYSKTVLQQFTSLLTHNVLSLKVM